MSKEAPTKKINVIEYAIDLLINEQLNEEHALLDLIFKRQQENRNITIIVTPNTELLIGPHDTVSKYGHYIQVSTDNKETKYLINTHNIIYVK